MGTANFSFDGSLVVTASQDRTARVWNAYSGECVYKIAGHTDAVFSACLSHNGKFLVTGSADFTARLWSLTPNEETGELPCLHVFEGHRDIVRCAVFSSV